MKTKSTVPATTKALQAWQSELRRLERRLAEWDQALEKREKNLEQQEAVFEAAIDGADEETIQMYANGFPQERSDGRTPHNDCDCDECEKTRLGWAKPEQPIVPSAGDEVEWLENLWKLGDSRKKKK